MSKENIIELERKFILDELPQDLTWRDVYDIKQSYIKVDGSVMRIRNINNTNFILTQKDRSNDVLGTIELEKDITAIEYLKLMDYKLDGLYSPVHKIRYEKTDQNGLIRCYDRFLWDLDGTIFAEVEFDDLLSYIDFKIPDWWKEITWLITNKWLYLHGKKALDIPKDKKVETPELIKEVESYLKKHKNILVKLYKTIDK